MKKKDWYSNQSDERVFAVCNLLFKEIKKQVSQPSPPKAGSSKAQGRRKRGASGKSQKRGGPVDRVVRTLREQGWQEKGLREKIYPLLWEGIERNFVIIRPPRHHQLQLDIANRYGIADEDTVRVVPARGSTAIEHVCESGAELVLRLIKQVWARKKERGLSDPRVRLALSAGHTSYLVARHLARLVHKEADCPPLALHALTSGFLVDRPASAPITFFHFFDAEQLDIKFVSLFAQALVRCDEYEHVKKSIGVKQSFELARDVDIVVTSLAWRHDPHGLLNQMLRHYKTESPADFREMEAYLEAEGWCGDVQYLPYSARGPIPLTKGIRAVTLFELPDLVQMAKSGDKHVVLLSGPCGLCPRTRTAALRPLLTEPSLHVWSHLVCDMQTAEELTARRAATSSAEHE